MTNALKLAGVTLPGVGYPKKKNFIVPSFPVKTGLVGLYAIGGVESLSLINHANTALPLLKVGVPTLNDLGATLNAANCYDTQIPSSADLTIISVAKMMQPSSIAAGFLILGNYLGGFPGDSLALDYSTSIPGPIVAAYGANGTGYITSSQSDATGTPGDWNSFAARFTATATSKNWWSKSGAVASVGSAVAGVRAVQARTLRIGGHYNGMAGNYGGTGDVQMVAIFNAALADADVAANLAYLTSTYGPAIGVTTL